MIAFSGVRISWLILASRSDLADDAFSAWRFAASKSASTFFHGVTSRNTAHSLPASSPIRPMLMNSGTCPPWRTRPVTSRPLFSMLDDAVLAHAVEIG